MKLPAFRTPSLQIKSVALSASLLAISSLLSGCMLEGTAPSSAAPKVPLGKVSGVVHGGRQGVAGANVYVYSPSTTGYGGAGIAASALNASTSLLTSSVPTSCGAGGAATAVFDSTPTDPAFGTITAINVTTQGAGYVAPGSTPLAPTVTITDPTGTGATATATLNSANGLGSITVTNPGTGYTAPVVTITPASSGACQDANGNYYVSSDANGNFSLNGDYTCTSGMPVYIYTQGGDAGGGTTGVASTSGTGTTSDAGFMSILGICGATTGPGAFSSSTYLAVNELTTVAAAYATAGFATNPTHIGVLVQQSAPATLTSSLTSLQTLEMTGLTNAFLTASNLYPSTTGNVGASPLTTPNGNGTLPNTKLNTLGNILADCVNSQNVSFSCENLLAITPGQTDTAGAAIYIAQHPGSNVASIYGLLSGNGQAYQPTLTASPADWTVSISYTGGGLTTDGTTCCGLGAHNLTSDASGNIWNLGNGTSPSLLTPFSNLGVPLSTAGYGTSTLYIGSGAVLDSASQNVFVAAETNAAGTTAETYLFQYNIAGNTWTTITPKNGTTSELNEPFDLAFDGSGNLWVDSINNESIVKLTAGTYAYAALLKNTTYVYYPVAIAAEPGAAGNIWVAGEGSSNTKKYADLISNADVFISDSVTDYQYAYSVAIDAAGSSWVANEVTALSNIPAGGGTATNYAYPTEYATPEILDNVIDGAGNIWLTDIDDGLIFEYNNSGALISGTKGYEPNEGSLATFIPPAKPPTGFLVPAYITVDGSGNVWTKIYGSATLQEMVGAATPVANPLAYATANSLIGQKP